MPGLLSKLSRRTDPAPLIFPVGHLLGSPVGDQQSMRIRRGVQVTTLALPAYAVWLLMHGPADPSAQRGPWTRAGVAELARAQTGLRADDLIDRLLLDGHGVEIQPGTPQAVEFAQNHRLVPLMPGLGNTPQEPWSYGIGMVGQQPRVRVTHPVYEVWQWSTVEESLWLTCLGIEQVARRAGSTNPDVINPERLLSGFLDVAHALLAAGVACWDVGFRLRRPDQPAAEARHG